VPVSYPVIDYNNVINSPNSLAAKVI